MNENNAFELTRLAKKFHQEQQIPQAIAAYEAAIIEYRQYLVGLKYIEEDIAQKINQLKKIVAHLKSPPAEKPPEAAVEATAPNAAGEAEARRVIYQAKKAIDQLTEEVKAGLEFSVLKQKVEEIYHDFKIQLNTVFNKDTETVKVYVRWLDNLINDLQKIILERKKIAVKEKPASPETLTSDKEPPTTAQTGTPAETGTLAKIAAPVKIAATVKIPKIGDHYKILIVDDEPDVVVTLEFLLKSEGFTVFKAPNGTEGIETARREKPHLIILDIKMPGISGYEAAQIIKDDEALKKTPIIFLTAVSQVVDPTYGIKTEVIADRYISKPYDVENFLKVIKEVLRIR